MSPIYLERTHRLKTTPRHAVPTTDVRALRRQGRVVAGWAARGVQGGAASTGRAAAALGEIGGAGCSEGGGGRGGGDGVSGGGGGGGGDDDGGATEAAARHRSATDLTCGGSHTIRFV